MGWPLIGFPVASQQLQLLSGYYDQPTKNGFHLKAADLILFLVKGISKWQEKQFLQNIIIKLKKEDFSSSERYQEVLSESS